MITKPFNKKILLKFLYELIKKGMPYAMFKKERMKSFPQHAH